MTEWVDELNKFLLIDETPPAYMTKTGRVKKRKDVIGTLLAGQDKTTGIIDVAMIGSVYRKGEMFPGLRLRKVEWMLFLLRPRQEAGVKVTVVTLNTDSSRFDAIEDLQSIIASMREAGVDVVLTDSDSEHYAVIDGKLVWHGGMNLLGKEDAWDNLIRVESDKAAAELLEMTQSAMGSATINCSRRIP